MRQSTPLYCKRGHYKTADSLWFSKYKDGYRPTDCKKCRTIRCNKWTRSNTYYMKFYKISKDDWNKLFSDQNGQCKICGIHQSSLKENLTVDHDHITLKVRGLVCRPCNLLLGNAKDDPSILQRAIVYLTSMAEVNYH